MGADGSFEKQLLRFGADSAGEFVRRNLKVLEIRGRFWY
jgi:hypothetical protein